ncbi:Nramp family divalent metal transporter [Saccharopolyspora sp. HNM0983]|uniref:Nramp family divalent metal transporter n=1 Tax=Saccharopolyspora montiporae TaxID=2781240 RepID=A0A929G2X8_9PSEU|nr:Nramp family divalent metal transporter [Saccharopolyspora sp. HNM0983]MBE9376298.1 Nramp family divalent metal transporter [Saccharopolyspora sp. HNM0983]
MPTTKDGELPEEGAIAHELPSRFLPPATYRNIPEPRKFRTVFGASIILTATAIGSGEFVLWPYITSQVGLVLMWTAVLGFFIQYVLNMEIERYTLATGETAVTGFTRIWAPLGTTIMLLAIIPNLWPGWGTGAATILTYVAGAGDPVIVAIAAMLTIGAVLTLSKVVYRTVEKIELVLVGGITVFLVVAAVIGTGASDWAAFGTSFAHVGRIPPVEELGGIAALLGAIAFAGAGGGNNLVQSNWARDKQMGMGGYLPRVTSPFTGHEAAAAGTGYMFLDTPDNRRRWRGWWRVANTEQFFTFFVLGCATLVIMSVLAYATVFGMPLPSGEFDFIREQGHVFAERFGGWFRTAFWAAGAIALFSTQIGIMDWVSRLTADTLKVTFFRTSTRITESRIYFGMVWLLIVAGSVILLSGMQEPLLLILISSSAGGVVMFLYSMLLIYTNRRFLPGAIRLRGWRLAMMLVAVVFYGYFSIALLADQLGKLV